MQNCFFCLSRKYKANKKFQDFFVSELSICLQLSRKESFGSSCFVMSIITAFLSLFCATLLLSLIASQTSIKIELLWHAKSVKNTLSQPFLLFCVCMVTRNKHLLRAHFWKVKDFYVSKFFPMLLLGGFWVIQLICLCSQVQRGLCRKQTICHWPFWTHLPFHVVRTYSKGMITYCYSK